MLTKVQNSALNTYCKKYPNGVLNNKQTPLLSESRETISFGSKICYFNKIRSKLIKYFRKPTSDVMLIPMSHIYRDPYHAVTYVCGSLDVSKINVPTKELLFDLLNNGKTELLVNTGQKHNSSDILYALKTRIPCCEDDVTIALARYLNPEFPVELNFLLNKMSRLKIKLLKQKRTSELKKINAIDLGTFKPSIFDQHTVKEYYGLENRCKMIKLKLYEQHYSSLFAQGAENYQAMKELSPEDAVKVGRLFDEGYFFKKAEQGNYYLGRYNWLKSDYKSTNATTLKDAFLEGIKRLESKS